MAGGRSECLPGGPKNIVTPLTVSVGIRYVGAEISALSVMTSTKLLPYASNDRSIDIKVLFSFTFSYPAQPMTVRSRLRRYILPLCAISVPCIVAAAGMGIMGERSIAGAATFQKLEDKMCRDRAKKFWSVPPKSSNLGRGDKIYYCQYFRMQLQMKVSI
jgi:hypothetical protein